MNKIPDIPIKNRIKDACVVANPLINSVQDRYIDLLGSSQMQELSIKVENFINDQMYEKYGLHSCSNLSFCVTKETERIRTCKTYLVCFITKKS